MCLEDMLKNADVDRIYLSYIEGGRGLMSLEEEYKATRVGLSMYMIKKDDPQVTALLKQDTQPMTSIQKAKG